MGKIQSLKVGTILSESSFFKVKQINPTSIDVVDDFGNELEIGKDYVESVINSADYFEKEEVKNMTDLANILINSLRIAMEVAFYKKDTVKTKKAYTEEVNAAIKRVQEAKVSEVEGLLKDLIENPVSKVISGELRIMRGRHYGHIDELGRLHFVDMEQTRDVSKQDDTRMRQIDPRSIQYIIVNGVKYSLKK